MTERDEKPHRKRWPDFLRSALDRPGFNIPPVGPFTARLVVEASPKAAKCRICGGLIPAKDNRVMVYYRHFFRRQRGNSTWSGDRYHYHISCVQDILAGEVKPQGCYVCGATTTDSSWWMLKVSGQAPYGKLCDQCVNRQEFGRCECCNCYFASTQLSRVIRLRDLEHEYGIFIFKVGELLCLSCEAENEAITRRSWPKHKEEFLRLSTNVTEAVKDLESWIE